MKENMMNNMKEFGVYKSHLKENIIPLSVVDETKDSNNLY